MVTWSAGIFYLPRLFVYYTETKEQSPRDTFKITEWRLWWLVTPFALFYGYHFYLYKLLKDFAADNNRHSPKFYRILNEAPVLVLLAVVLLAALKPRF